MAEPPPFGLGLIHTHVIELVAHLHLRLSPRLLIIPTPTPTIFIIIRSIHTKVGHIRRENAQSGLMLEHPNDVVDVIVTTHSSSKGARTRPQDIINIVKAGSAIVDLFVIIASGRQVIVVGTLCVDGLAHGTKPATKNASSKTEHRTHCMIYNGTTTGPGDDHHRRGLFILANWRLWADVWEEYHNGVRVGMRL